MSISQNFGNVSPSLLLDFANTKTLDRRITFTRSTPACHYDGKTTAMAEQNLIIGSQTFVGSKWYLSSPMTLTANNAQAPDATTTAALLNVASTGAFFYQSAPYPVNGEVVTVSLYVKQAPSSSATYFRLTTNNTYAWGTGTSTKVALTSSWQRVTVSAVVGGGYYAVMNIHMDGNDVNGTKDPDCYGNVLIWGAQLEQRSSATAYTATTTQPITNYIPVLLTAGGNQPRFDCNPTTGESLGLLIEEQRTNNVLNSQNFNNWTKYNCTVNNAAIISPSGSLDGNKLISSATTNGQTIESSSATFVSGSIYTLSVYAKAGEYRYIQMSLPSFVTTQYVNADLVSGTINGGSYISASITSVGNGWYRISFSFTSSYSGATVAAGISLQTTVNPARGTSITGDGFSGFYIWGAQQELGSFATSYIATTSASATRTADDANIRGSNFNKGWFNNAQGTLYVNGSKFGTNLYPRFAGFYSQDTESYSIGIGQWNSSNVTFYGVNNGSTEFNLSSFPSGLTWGSEVKAAGGYAFNDIAFTANNQPIATDTSATIPVVTRLDIGSGVNNPLNGWIKKIAYYPIRVSNTNLQALTS